ncbi:MAG: DUF5702 domain-containing protein [Lachnospiraceae bacterium]|nr:DUF5702 domain-containing protein [Lachnospiraceae bacterium]
MNNRGKITVFLCLMVCAVLLLAMTGLQVITFYGGQAKAAMCLKTATSHIKSNYNRYIFDHYHILLFDKACGGKGEAGIEEILFNNLQENLGTFASVQELSVNQYNMLTENDCRALREQIADYIKYAAIEYGTDQILEMTGGEDGALSEDLLTPSEEETETTAETGIDCEDVEDPRGLTAYMEGDLLMAAIVPEELKISEYYMQDDEGWSVHQYGHMGDFFQINNRFNSLGVLSNDLVTYGGWSDQLLQAGTEIAYAADVFNCATEQTINDTSVLVCELEYLVSGLPCDAYNLESAIHRILGIRLPVNYAFLMTDPEKKAVVMEVAAPLSALTLVPLPIMKRLIAGCWAYVEAITEVRCLLNGNRMSFTKNSENWITDLHNLGEDMFCDGSSDDKGLSYKDYLLILLAIQPDTTVYRMVDIIQLNARQENDNFWMDNAAVGFSVDVKIQYDGREIWLREEAKY